MVLKDYLFHVLRVDTMIGWTPGRLPVLSALFDYLSNIDVYRTVVTLIYIVALFSISLSF